MAHYLDKDGLQRFFNGLKNVFAAKNHTHTTVNGHTVESDVPANAKFTDTTYSAASQSAAGLMSAADKKAVDNVPKYYRGLQGGTAIAASTDLNTLTTPGNYYCSSSSTAQSLAHSPTTTWFYMFVSLNDGYSTAWPSQEIVEGTTGKRYYRYKNGSNDWVAWTTLTTRVKGNAESSYRSGDVNLTAANIGAAAASHNHSASNITAGTLAAARLPAMTGATASAAGTQGAVPAPAAGKQSQFLRGDGNWATPSNNKVNVTLATTTKAYLLGTSTTPTTSAKGVTALADTGVYLDTTAGRLTATSFAGNGLLLTNLDAGNLYAGTVPRERLPLASSTQAGAMSAGDKAKLDSIIVTGANSVYLFKFSFAQNTFDSQQSLLYQVEDDDVGFDSTWLPEIIVPPQAGTYSSYASSLKGPIKVTTQADNVLWFQSSYPLLSSLTLWIKLTKTYQSNITEQELSA